MRTHSHARLLALASIALFLTAACGQRDDTATRVDTAAGTVASISVTEIDIGKRIGADKRLTDETDDFMPTDTVYAVVSTSGSAPSATLEARWLFEDGQIVGQTSETIAPTGPAVTEFHIMKPDGFPRGTYRVEILLNGSPAGTKEFTVR